LVDERPFFQSRYAYAGFTFLLIVILLTARNVIPLLKSKAFSLDSGSSPNPEFGAALLGIVFVLNGAPIGFLISQPWFLFQRYALWTNDPLYKKFKGKLPKGTPREQVIAEADIWVWNLDDDRVLGYIERRVDVMNILGSVAFAIPFGFLVGIIVRFHYQDALQSELI